MPGSVGIPSPSPGSEIKRSTSSALSLVMQWKAVTFRATFYGQNEQSINLSGALMHGKAIGLS